MARTEYYDDPAAPEPNSLVVAASAVVTDDEGRVLLQRRRDNDLWALPGGGMEMTDSLPGTAVREVKEETGLDVEITGLVGTYTDPRHVIAYSDGEVRRQFNICFTPARSAANSRSRTSPQSCGSSSRRRSLNCLCTTRSGSGSVTSWSTVTVPISADSYCAPTATRHAAVEAPNSASRPRKRRPTVVLDDAADRMDD